MEQKKSRLNDNYRALKDKSKKLKSVLRDFNNK